MGAAVSRVSRDGCDAHRPAYGSGESAWAGLVGGFDGVVAVRAVDLHMIEDDYQNSAAARQMPLTGALNLERVHDHGRRD